MSTKVGKRIKKGLAYFFVFYVLLFFAIAPMRNVVTEWQTHIGMKIIGYTQKYLYWSWVGKLEEENIIREIWSSNQLYWCIQSESCSVKT
ncbi:MAG: hypothetical protein KC484_05860 [Colwelliaceae bacterium]|nr:hypothetical protein [Colwelliaceae bacterium]